LGALDLPASSDNPLTLKGFPSVTNLPLRPKEVSLWDKLGGGANSARSAAWH